MKGEVRILNAVTATIPTFEVTIDRHQKIGGIQPIILYVVKDEDNCREVFVPMSTGHGGEAGYMELWSEGKLGICYDYGKYQIFDYFDSSSHIPLMQHIFNKCKEKQITTVDIDENCGVFRDYDEEQKHIDEIMKK